MKRKIVFSLIGLLGVIVVGANACDNVRLSLMPAPVLAASVGTVGQVCSPPPVQASYNTKIMFLVDQSGSNCSQTGNPPPCDTSGTDFDKSYRLSVMQNFINGHLNNNNLYYGFISFHDVGGVAYINDGSDADATFSNVPADINNAINRFETTMDEGGTPYRAALAMATQAVATDRAASNATTSKYYIVLMSDGQPSDYGSPPDQTQIDTDVTTLLSTAGTGTTLSTIYYNPLNIATDANLLLQMATTGGGGFDNTNTQGRNVPLEQIIAYQDAIPWVITQFMVTNLNAAPCDDGTMGADSDADGICDKDEARYNTMFANDTTLSSRMNGLTFDPQNRNSFGPTYNDLFNYRHIMYGENLDSTCLLTGDITQDDQDHDLINTCEEKFLASTTPAGPNAKWTAAMGTNTDPLNFDSDGDGFLDWIEFAFTRSKSAPMDFNSTADSVNGYSMAQILLQHRNPINPSAATPYDGDFHFTAANAQGENCYSYSQTVLPLYHTLPTVVANESGYTQLAHGTDQNVIMIYFIQKQENSINGAGQLMYTFQTVNYSDPTLNLNLDISQYGMYDASGSLVGKAQ
jgi:hypothetical protein